MKVVPNALSRTVSRQMLLGKKNSPEILFGVGVVGMIGSTVLACRATLKMTEVLEETQNDLDIARNIDSPERYSENDRRKDVMIIRSRGIMKIGRMYAPAILLGTASIGCLTKSHNLLNQRNVALTAAYATIDEAFSRYRARVIEKYGEDEDRNLRFTTEEVDIIDDRGQKRTVTRVGPDPDGHSMYARFFDEYSPSWSKEPEYNFVFLKCQQNYANEMLRSRGYLFLNDVYDMLGIERSQAGQVVGWVISEGEGDNYVDFGLWDDKENVRDFVNGREGSILLDFNVDGVIYDKIESMSRKERVRWQS